MRWSVEELIKYWGYYRERSVYYWFRNFFSNRKRRIKLLFRWISKGYCEESMWSLDDYFSEIILFRLKKFQKMNRMGYPSQFKNQEEWNSKLKEMIEKFEILINRSIEDQVDLSKAGFEKEVEIDGKIVYAWTSGKTDEERKADIEIYLKQAKNDSEAIELFKELYFDLWD